MRGKLILSDKSINQSGITPADAGKTKNEKVFHVLKQDHPRGCGENYPSDHISTKRPGSPPRMRGKRALNQAVSGIGRITPADAGKTASMDSTLKSPEDHPRGCGENCNINFNPHNT